MGSICFCAQSKLKRCMERTSAIPKMRSQYQTSVKMMDENNESFGHDTEFHEFRTAVAARLDL